MHEPSTPLLPARTGLSAAHSKAGLARAVEYGRTVQGDLRPDDPRLDYTVHMACTDGTNLNLPHAFIEKAGEWVYVFTRDHGWFVEHKDTLATCTTTERAPLAV